MSSYGMMWQPCSFVGPLLLLCLIWLNWFKSREKWCHRDRDVWRGGQCSGADIIMTLMLQGNRVRGGSWGSWGVTYALRTRDVAPREAPVAKAENHKEASCPVMIDGETNGLWSSIICETNSEVEDASAIIHSPTVWLRQGTANAVPCDLSNSDQIRN